MSDKYNLRPWPTLVVPTTTSEGSAQVQVSGWPGPMSTELDAPMPAQAGVPLVEGTHEIEAGVVVVVGHVVMPYTDVSEGSSRSESTLTADLDINPEVESELELEQTHDTAASDYYYLFPTPGYDHGYRRSHHL